MKLHAAEAPQQPPPNQPIEHGQFSGDDFTATYPSGRRAMYRAGTTLGFGAAGLVRRYGLVQTSHGGSAPGRALAIKQFHDPDDFQRQSEVSAVIRRDPAIAHLMVDARPFDGRIVMPEYRTPGPQDDPWDVWSQTRDAMVFLKERGYAYFDLKRQNLLMTGAGRVVLADIDGLRAPGEEWRRFVNTFSYPGHDGTLWLTDNSAPSAEQLSTHFALMQLALELLDLGGSYKSEHPPLFWATISVEPLERIFEDLHADLARARAATDDRWHAAFLVHESLLGDMVLLMEQNQIKSMYEDDDASDELMERLTRCRKLLVFYDPRHELPDHEWWETTMERLPGGAW